MPKKTLVLFFKGMAMGTANKIPGVSGGTIAYMLQFYEELVYSFKQFDKKAFLYLFAGKFRSFYSHINGTFLIPLFAGNIFSFFSVSQLLDWLLTRFEIYVWAFFLGLILATIYFLYLEVKHWSVLNALFFLVSLLIGTYISFVNPSTENPNLWFVFFCGIISISGMTIPGLSGSFIVLLLGNYVLIMVDAVNVFYEGITHLMRLDFSFFSTPNHREMMYVLLVFTLGSGIGLVYLSKILHFILARNRNQLYAAILGFVVGTLGVIWPWKNSLYLTDEQGKLVLNQIGKPIVIAYEKYVPTIDLSFLGAICLMVLGILLVLFLEKTPKLSSTQKTKGQ